MLDSIISHQIQYMPDSQLAQEVKQPTGAMPSWMALSELKRRQDLRQGSPVQSPQGTVADSVIKAVAASGMQPQGMGVSGPSQPPGGIMGGSPMSQPTGAGIMASAPPVHMASGGSVGAAVQQPGQGIMDGPAPIDPSVGQTAYQNPNLMSLDQASNAVHGLYGQGADMAPIYQQIADLQAKANHPYGTKEALRDIGMRMMANPTGNILSSIGDAAMGATANQRAMEQKSLEDNKALLGLRATIQEKQQERQDKIADNITKYQDANNVIADNQAKALNAFNQGNTDNALSILKHNQTLQMDQKKFEQTSMKNMADPAEAQAALLQAQALVKDPAIQADPVKLKKAQDSVDYLTGVINADHSEDARTAGLKQQNELALEHARSVEALRNGLAIKAAAAGPEIPTVDPNASVEDLSKDMIGQAAIKYIQAGKDGLPPFSKGNAGQAALQAVMNRAALISNKLGIDPGQSKIIESNYKSQDASLKKMQQSYNNASISSEQLDKNIEILKKAYADVPRTGIPLLDKFGIAAQSAAGKGATQALTNAIENVTNEFSKYSSSLSGGGNAPASDASKNHALKVFNDYMSKGQLEKGLEVINQERQNKLTAFQNEMSNTAKHMTIQGLKGMASGDYSGGAASGGSSSALPDGGGKQLDKATAMLFYKASGNDPQKARQLALGHNFKVQ